MTHGEKRQLLLLYEHHSLFMHAALGMPEKIAAAAAGSAWGSGPVGAGHASAVCVRGRHLPKSVPDLRLVLPLWHGLVIPQPHPLQHLTLSCAHFRLRDFISLNQRMENPAKSCHVQQTC